MDDKKTKATDFFIAVLIVAAAIMTTTEEKLSSSAFVDEMEKHCQNDRQFEFCVAIIGAYDEVIKSIP